MALSTWLLYLSVISILIFSPGPSALLCLSHGLRFGKSKAIPTILGGAVAALVLMTVSAIGLGAVLVTSETLFFSVKIIGALYLIYLGCSTWKDGRTKISNISENESKLVNYSYRSLFQKGFMVGISNPKDILFFIALFPTFINANLPQYEQYSVMALTWFIIDCSAMFIYAGLGSTIGPWLSKTHHMKLVNRIIGTVFIGLGSVLAIATGGDLTQ